MVLIGSMCWTPFLGLFQPIGALLLEHCRITKEEENVFSISEFCARAPFVSPLWQTVLWKRRCLAALFLLLPLSLVTAGLVFLSPLLLSCQLFLWSCRAPGPWHFSAGWNGLWFAQLLVRREAVKTDWPWLSACRNPSLGRLGIDRLLLLCYCILSKKWALDKPSVGLI